MQSLPPPPGGKFDQNVFQVRATMHFFVKFTTRGVVANFFFCFCILKDFCQSVKFDKSNIEQGRPLPTVRYRSSRRIQLSLCVYA